MAFISAIILLLFSLPGFTQARLVNEEAAQIVYGGTILDIVTMEKYPVVHVLSVAYKDHFYKCFVEYAIEGFTVRADCLRYDYER